MATAGRNDIPRGADLVVETLIRLKAQHAFNVIGLGMYELGNAFAKRRDEIKYVSALNESNLSLIATGYARATRKPAFACVYYSSGTAFSLVGLSVAWAERLPLVLCTTSNSRLASGRDQYAAVPRSVLELGSQYSKWSYEIPTVERIPEVLARAFAIASTPPMGPVHIAIPSDLYLSEAAGDLPCADFDGYRLFGESCADEAGLTLLAGKLAGAKSPVILAGAEVSYYGAIPQLVALAETAAVPVMIESQAAHMGFPTAHPNFAGFIQSNRDLLANADVAISLGVEFSMLGRPDEPLAFPKGPMLAAMSVDPRLPTRHVWPDIALTGHPKPSLTRLLERMPHLSDAERDIRNARLETIRERRVARIHAARALPTHDGMIARWEIMDEMKRFAKDDWIFVEAGTTANAHLEALFPMAEAELYHGLSGKASAQGWGAPTAIGVQLGSPDRRVLAFVGDGNLMFSGNSLYEAARNKLPIVFVIANNGGWAHLPSAMKAFLGGADESGDFDLGQDFTNPPIRIADYARSLAVDSVVATSAAELRAHLETARGHDSGPFLIEAMVASGD